MTRIEALACASSTGASPGAAQSERLRRLDGHADAEHRTMPRARFHIDGVIKQIGESLHDGETKPQPLAALARGIVDLVKLLEDRQTILLGNSRSRVPDLDAHCVATPAAPEQHLAVRREFHGVGEQVAENLLQQSRIASHDAGARHDAPVKTLRSHVIAKVRVEMLEQSPMESSQHPRE